MMNIDSIDNVTISFWKSREEPRCGGLDDALLYYYYNRSNRAEGADKRMVVLTEITIYPIKGTAGISMETAMVEERGLQWDRRCMVVDSQNVCMTQRVFPRLALISVAVRDNALRVSASGMQQYQFPLPVNNGGTVSVQVWDDTVEALTFPKEADRWFSSFLGVSCRPVYMPDTTRRIADPSRTPSGQVVSFADAFPFLLISEGSLALLNTKLSTPISMNRFRPNLVVAGCDPHAEDTWHHIRIGPVEFLVVKPCARCVVTTVEQESGIKGPEPLRTLSTYRQRDGKILFGENMISTTRGMVRVGDPVTILS